MKPERPNEDVEPVRRVLQEWQVKSPLPPGFAANVWRRIESAEPVATTASDSALWIALKSWAAEMLPRPAFAVAYVTLLLVSGLLAGYWHARHETTNWDKLLASRYVQTVDPFQRSIHD